MIFTIYFQKILVRKLLAESSVKISKNYKILVLLGLNMGFFLFCFVVFFEGNGHIETNFPKKTAIVFQVTAY